MRAVYVCFVGLLFLLSAPLSGLASQWSVCNQTSCNFPTIANAISVASPNDTIVVKDGSYSEPRTILNIPLAFIFLQSNGGVQVDCQTGDSWLLVTSAWTTIGSFVLNGSGINIQAGSWTQNGNVTITNSPSFGIEIQQGANWTQNGTVTLQQTQVYGIYVGGEASRWQQNGSVTISSMTGTGIYFHGDGGGATWTQNASVHISNVDGYGIYIYGAGAAVWIQNNTLTIANIKGSGIYLPSNTGGADWSQNGDVLISNTTILGIYLGCGATNWKQNASVTINNVSTGKGIYLGSGGGGVKWTQNSDVAITNAATTGLQLSDDSLLEQSQTINISGSAIGVDFSRGGSWQQSGFTYIDTYSSAAVGVFCNNSATCCSLVSSSSSIIFTPHSGGNRDDCIAPSPSATPSATPSAAPEPVVVVEVGFNLTVPVVAISQSGGATGPQTQRVDLNLLSLEEISPQDGAVLQTIDLQMVGWMLDQKNDSKSSGNATTSIFTSQLGSATGGANNASLQYYFDTFDSDSLITTKSNYSFKVTPALLKFSLNISSWNWNSTSGLLRLTIRIQPPFVRFAQWDDTPQTGMTTFLFSSARADQPSTIVHLLNFAEASEAGGGLSLVSVEASASVNSSSLSLTFGHFNDSLLFDPDVGLLLGSKGGSGGDDVGLIVGVAVAVPLAVGFVVVVIAAVLVTVAIKRRSFANTQSAIDFEVSPDDDDQL